MPCQTCFLSLSVSFFLPTRVFLCFLESNPPPSNVNALQDSLRRLVGLRAKGAVVELTQKVWLNEQQLLFSDSWLWQHSLILSVSHYSEPNKEREVSSAFIKMAAIHWNEIEREAERWRMVLILWYTIETMGRTYWTPFWLIGGAGWNVI